MERNSVSDSVLVKPLSSKGAGNATSSAWLQVACLPEEWDVSIMGKRDMPLSEIVTPDGYRILPFKDDTSPRPKWVDERVERLPAMGYSLDRLIVIHEPEDAQTESNLPQALPQKFGITAQNAERVKKALLLIAGAAAAVVTVSMLITALVAIAAALMALIIPPALFGLALVGLVTVDPVLVLVLEDNTWVQIAAWR